MISEGVILSKNFGGQITFNYGFFIIFDTFSFFIKLLATCFIKYLEIIYEEEVENKGISNIN